MGLLCGLLKRATKKTTFTYNIFIGFNSFEIIYRYDQNCIKTNKTKT